LNEKFLEVLIILEFLVEVAQRSTADVPGLILGLNICLKIFIKAGRYENRKLAIQKRFYCGKMGRLSFDEYKQV
jgi:hypothetical protein